VVHGEEFDVVICGHIHHAEITDYHSICYMNCRDWVEGCAVLVEKKAAKLMYDNFVTH